MENLTTPTIKSFIFLFIIFKILNSVNIMGNILYLKKITAHSVFTPTQQKISANILQEFGITL